MFKRLFMLMLLSATFLSGYYLGRKPGSPDVFKMAENGYKQAAELGKILESATDAEGLNALDSLQGRQLANQSASAGEPPQASARPEVTGDVKLH